MVGKLSANNRTFMMSKIACTQATTLRAKKEDHIVIFDYYLSPNYLNRADGNSFEEGGPSSGYFSVDDDIFFQVPKNELVESRQFDQIINLAKEPSLIPSRRQRLGIM